jgi:hypothetical protein
VLGGIEPDDLVAAVLRGLGLGDERRGVVARALGLTGATRGGADIVI